MQLNRKNKNIGQLITNKEIDRKILGKINFKE